MSFRHDNQNQLVLFPHTFDDLISIDHPVRIVNDVLDKININTLLKAYRKEGNPSYHPVMMLKVMVFAYMENIYSSRKIEKAMRENVLFMWLSNMNIADRNTIAKFRSHKLQSAFKDIFTQVILLLAEEEALEIEAFVKYNTFDKEQDENYQNKHKTFSKEHLYYNEEQDFYVCPMGERMEKTHESTTTNKNGFVQKHSHYQAQNCNGCPLRNVCHGSKKNRMIERNHNLERHKELAR